jgi:hypothetical protein
MVPPGQYRCRGGQRGDPLQQGCEVDRLALEGDRAPPEPLEVEQVRQHPVQTASAGRDALQQLGAGLLVQPAVGLFQGPAGPEDGGERRAQLVRAAARKVSFSSSSACSRRVASSCASMRSVTLKTTPCQ